MIVIIDYDAGNIMSVEKAVRFLGAEVTLSSDKETILSADKVILPGVGSFGAAIESLKKYDLIDTIKEVVNRGTPFFGICLGMQMLLDSSDESPGIEGLGLISGKCLKMPAKGNLKIPHVGWNSIEITNKSSKILKELEDDSYFYFVHSYYASVTDRENVAAMCTYTTDMDVVIEKDNIMATQFHPEKSSSKGLKLLKNFIDL